MWPVYSKGGLYGSVPVIVSHSEKINAGFYWRNTSETYIEVEKK